MSSTIKISNLNKQSDINKINNILSQIEGIIACEISINKKEVQIVYNESIVKLDEIIGNIEDIGYMVI